MGTKTFYTVRDMELLAEQGVRHLTLTAETVVTDLAREQAAKLGLTLLEGEQNSTPLPSKPIRPQVDRAATLPTQLPTDLAAKVKAVVMTQMNGQVSEALLDTIIHKVIDQLNLK